MRKYLVAILFFCGIFFFGRANPCGVTSSFTASGGPVLQSGSVLTLTSTSTNATSFSWTLNGLLSYSTGTTYSIPVTPGVYDIRLIARNGTCSDTSLKTFVVHGTPPPDSLFRLKFGTERYHFVDRSLLATADSGYVSVVDAYLYTTQEPPKTYLVKTDKAGCVQWSRFLYRPKDNGLSNAFNTIKEARDGNLLLLFYTEDGQAGLIGRSSSLLKLSAKGDPIWQKNFTFGNENGFYTDFEEVDDGFVAKGQYADTLFVSKFDNQGNLKWHQSYKFTSTLRTYSLTFFSGAVYITGYYAASSNQQYQSFMMKFDPGTGALLWSKNYVYKDFLAFSGVKASANRMVLSMLGTDGPMYGMIDTTGSINGVRLLDINYKMGQRSFSFFPIDQDNILMVYLGTELLNVQPYNSYHTVVAKIRSDGTMLWAQQIAGNSDAYHTHAAVSPEGSIGLLGDASGTLEKQYAFSNAVSLVKMTNNGSTPPCYYAPHQIFTKAVSVTGTSFTPSAAHHGGIRPATFQHMVDHVHTESIFDCQEYYQGCNTFSIGNFDTTCNIQKIHTLKYYKGTGCLSPVSLRFDPARIQLVEQTDSLIRFRFLRYGSSTLVMTLNGPCHETTDSITLSAVDKSISNFSLGPDLGLCAGMTKTLSAGKGFTSYRWQDSSTSSTFTVKGPGSYWVTVGDSCGNTYSDTVQAMLTSSVPVDAGADTAKCNADSVLLSAPAGFTEYSWLPAYNILNPTSPRATVFPAVDTAYFLTVKTAQGCVGYDTIRIKVNRSVPLSLGPDTTLCSSGQLLLHAGASYLQYLWSTGSTSASLPVTAAGIYSLAATDRNGCTSRDTIAIQVSVTPVFSLGNDTTVCAGRSLVLRGPQQGNYNWQDGSKLAQQVVTSPGIYWLEVSNKGCLYRDSVLISSKPVPMVNLGSDTVLCEGSSALLQIVQPYTSVHWQDGSANALYKVTGAGTYWVNVDLDGCSASDTVKIGQKLRPRFSLGPDTLLCEGQSFAIGVSLPGSALRWNTGSTSSQITVNTTGTYSLTATNECGSTTDDLVVRSGVCSVNMPSAFTPNHDGKNDLFRIPYPQLIKTVHLKIFNRFGQIIFVTQDPFKGWDGTFHGIPQDTGNYLWMISYRLQDGTEGNLKGNVVLIR